MTGAEQEEPRYHNLNDLYKITRTFTGRRHKEVARLLRKNEKVYSTKKAIRKMQVEYFTDLNVLHRVWKMMYIYCENSEHQIWLKTNFLEIQEAALTLKNNKAAGSYGIPKNPLKQTQKYQWRCFIFSHEEKLE